MYTHINTIVIVCSYCKLPYIKEIVIVVYCIIYSCSNSDCYVFRYQFVHNYFQCVYDCIHCAWLIFLFRKQICSPVTHVILRNNMYTCDSLGISLLVYIDTQFEFLVIKSTYN